MVPVPDAFGVADRGIDQYQPIEKRRLLPEGLDPDDVVKCTVVPRRSSVEIFMAV